jgi:hypothetical protein
MLWRQGTGGADETGEFPVLLLPLDIIFQSQKSCTGVLEILPSSSFVQTIPPPARCLTEAIFVPLDPRSLATITYFSSYCILAPLLQQTRNIPQT